MADLLLCIHWNILMQMHHSYIRTYKWGTLVSTVSSAGRVKIPDWSKWISLCTPKAGHILKTFVWTASSIPPKRFKVDFECWKNNSSNYCVALGPLPWKLDGPLIPLHNQCRFSDASISTSGIKVSQKILNITTSSDEETTLFGRLEGVNNKRRKWNSF